jgi:hypothetical protein
MQYRSRCNIFNSFRNVLLFRYIYKGRLVKIIKYCIFILQRNLHVHEIFDTSPLSLVCTREVTSKIIFARKQTRDKQDGGIILNTYMYILQRNMVKCNCHKLKYLVQYNKRVIALILRNIVPCSISYCTVPYSISYCTVPCSTETRYRVIALILRNIVPNSISYCTRLRVQYDILQGTVQYDIL